MTTWDTWKAEREQNALRNAFREKHADIIDGAIALLKPTNATRDQCQKDVVASLMAFLLQKAGWFHTTRPARRAADDLARSLVLVETTAKNPNLNSSLLADLPLTEIHKLRLRSERWKKLKVDGKGLRKGATEKKAAVVEAHFLMTKYRPSEVEKAVRGNCFSVLAALFYGDPGADLSFQCATFLRESRRKSG